MNGPHYSCPMCSSFRICKSWSHKGLVTSPILVYLLFSVFSFLFLIFYFLFSVFQFSLFIFYFLSSFSVFHFLYFTFCLHSLFSFLFFRPLGMQLEAQQAMLTGRTVFPYFVLKVSREQIVTDTLTQLLLIDESDLKKPLKVRIILI